MTWIRGIWERSSVQADGLDFRLGLCAVVPGDEIRSLTVVLVGYLYLATVCDWWSQCGEQGQSAVSLVFCLLVWWSFVFGCWSSEERETNQECKSGRLLCTDVNWSLGIVRRGKPSTWPLRTRVETHSPRKQRGSELANGELGLLKEHPREVSRAAAQVWAGVCTVSPWACTTVQNSVQ